MRDNVPQENQQFAGAGMLIRRPVEQVFESFIDPEITTNFWFTKSTGRLDENDEVIWTWEMYNHTVPLLVESIIKNETLENQSIRKSSIFDDQKLKILRDFRGTENSMNFRVKLGLNGEIMTN